MSLTLRDPAFVARLTAGGVPPPSETLLAEMQYTGYSVGQLVPDGTALDDFTTAGDYGFRHRVVASSYGTSLKAARFPTYAEAGSGSNGSLYGIQLRVPRTTRGNRSRIKFKVYQKSPATGNFAAETGTGIAYLLWWGTTNVRTIPGAGVATGLRIYTGTTQRAEVAYTYAADTWYLHTYDVKMDASAGFVDLRVEKADGTNVSTLRWEGNTGAENDTNGYVPSWGSDATVHNFVGSTASSSDTACFPIMGPVMVYAPGA